MRPPLTSIYGTLLREVAKQSPQRALWLEHFRHMFRAATAGGHDPTLRLALQRDAEDLMTFMRAERRLKDLRERYKVAAMDDQERIRKSAQRVGLQLPKMFADVEDGVPARGQRAA